MHSRADFKQKVSKNLLSLIKSLYKLHRLLNINITLNVDCLMAKHFQGSQARNACLCRTDGFGIGQTINYCSDGECADAQKQIGHLGGVISKGFTYTPTILLCCNYPIRRL